jgi:hypothetical protein
MEDKYTKNAVRESENEEKILEEEQMERHC